MRRLAGQVGVKHPGRSGFRHELRDLSHKLPPRDVLGAKRQQVIGLELAIDQRKRPAIELGGQAFYGRAARETEDPVLRELFERFVGMEREHMQTLSRRYHVEVPAPSPAFSTDRAALYAGVDSRPEDPANLFRLALAFERRAVEFFERRAQEPGMGAAERELYRELAAEEAEHVALLTTELERWRQGRPGLL